MEFVNVRERKDGTLEETKERTGVWAWKHPHKAEGTVTYKKMEGGIVFDGVDFGYDPSKMVLHDIKLFAEPGQKIAFVGSTGAGKTTITNLINRFYDIQDGKIRYDGININKIKKPAAAPWASCSRTPTSLQVLSWTISDTESWTLQMRNASMQQNWPTQTAS